MSYLLFVLTMAKVMIYFLSANTLQVFSRLPLYFCNLRNARCLLVYTEKQKSPLAADSLSGDKLLCSYL